MLAGWLLLQAERPLPGGYGVALLQSLLALVAVCILAWVVLRWSAKAGLGLGGRGEHLEVVERLALDHRRSVVVVRVGKRLMLLGVGENAAPTLLAELEPSELPRGEAKVSFLEVLRRKERSAEPPSAAPSAAERPVDGEGRDPSGNDDEQNRGAA
jgi:flagellar biosynthetic protein FliO